jgi:molybdenum cofactor synthesis domain-containing protein
MAEPPAIVSAAVLLIGNEILSGRTKDANLNYLARQLTALGIRLREARVVVDETAAIVAAVNECRARYDYVFTTGGIGPTHDDITAAAVAEAFGRPLIRNPEAVRILQDFYRETGRELNEARLHMAETPDGATLIDNPLSRAPGFRVENVFVMAGIPAVMRAMFESVAPSLASGDKVQARTVAAFVAEGDIAKRLGALQERYPALEIGSYPFMREGRFGTSLVLRGTDAALIERAGEELVAEIRALGVEPEAEEGEGA